MATFNLGKDTSLVVISPFGTTLDLSIVTNFDAKQETHKVRVRPLNGPTQGLDVPDGWNGTFTVERANSAADDLISDIEAGFWAGGLLGTGQVYQYVNEINGGRSEYVFNGVTFTLSNAGAWAQDNSVKQTVEFFASTRNKLS